MGTRVLSEFQGAPALVFLGASAASFRPNPVDWTVTGPRGREGYLFSEEDCFIPSDFAGANKKIQMILPPARETNHQR